MVRRSLILGAIALLGMLGVRSTPAAPISFTGNVANDFPVVPGNNVMVTPDSAINHATLPTWMTSAGLSTGMDIKDVRMSYDQATDTLSVGINFKGIGGDVDGNGTVGTVSDRAAQSGTFEPLRFANSQTVSVGLFINDPTKTGMPDLVVGIPVSKPVDAAGKPIDGVSAFTIAKYADNPAGLPNGFGASTVGSVKLLDHLGAKSIETSAAKPDIEFQITKFSEVAKAFNSQFDPTKNSLAIMGFSADPQASIIGKSTLYYAFTAPLAQETPEPATLLAWSAVLGLGVVYRFRTRRTMQA